VVSLLASRGVTEEELDERTGPRGH